MRRIPRPAALAAVSLAVLTSAGCVTNPLTTQLQYAPADGEVVRLEHVTIANALIVAEKQGAPGNFLARVVNDGRDPVTLLLASEELGVDLTVRVPGGQSVEIGPDGDEELLIEEVPLVPGELAPFTAAVRDTELAAELLVPVHDGALPRFEELLPESGTSS